MSQSSFRENHDSEAIAKYVRSLDPTVESFPDDQKSAALGLFEDYECWVPFLRLINKSIDDPKKRKLDDYVKKIRVQNLFMGDSEAACASARKLVEDLGFGFDAFVQQVLPFVITDAFSFSEEAILLEGVMSSFAQRGDKVLCLERLCFIYEKKIFDDRNLNLSFDRLVSIEPRNIKALKYFKVLSMQKQNWDETIRILEVLHDLSESEEDKNRLGLEIAAISLYQLDKPDRTLRSLEKYCQDSKLDKTRIEYEAHFRLQDWKSCQRVLLNVEERITADADRAIIHYRLGEIEEKLSRFSKAREHYAMATTLKKGFLEPVEKLIYLAVQDEDWNRVVSLLRKLKPLLSSEALGGRIDEVLGKIGRLTDRALG